MEISILKTPDTYPLKVPEDCTLYLNMVEAGNKFTDHSGYHNDATNSGSTQIAAPWLPARSVDNSDDRISVAASASIASYGHTATTWEVWCYANSRGAGNFGRLVGSGQSGNGVDCGFAGNQQLRFILQHATTDAKAQMSANLSYSAWHHVCFVYNEDADMKIKIYVDSALQSLGTNTAGIGDLGDDTGAIFYIGNWNTDTTRPWNGYIGIVRIYKRALSATGILAAYNEHAWRYRG